MKLNDISIRVKLPFTIIAGLFLFAGVVLLYTMTLHHTIAQYEHLLAHDLMIRQTAQNITIQMLQARRAEKDFLLRKEVKQIALVDQSIELAMEQARLIGQLNQDSQAQEEISQRLVLMDHLATYRTLFDELASLWQEKGLTYQEGQQKVFLQAANQLEAAIQSFINEKRSNEIILEIMVAYLTLHRMEKNYFIRQEKAFILEVERVVKKLESGVQQTSLPDEKKKLVNQLLLEYWSAFVALVALEQKIDEKTSLLRETIHKVEPLVAEIESIAVRLTHENSLQTRQSVEKIALWIFAGSLLTMLLCGYLSIYMVRGVVRSIGMLWTFSHEVAIGNLEAKIAPLGLDEMGHLAQVLVEMVNRMRAIRLIADRMVMILALISRGAIPDELDVEFHGDFQKISNALNEMIGRMRELHLIAAQIDRISQGQVPDKIVGQFQGDFKRINDAMNTIIDKLQELGGWPTSIS